jgi:serine/threonine-protein kinase
VVLYEMLTGELPFDADTPLGIAMKHVNGHLRPPRTVNPAVPAGINAVTVRLLAKHPEDRYASDAELIEDLERVAAGLEPAEATTEMMTRAMPAAVPAATTRLAPAPPPQRARREKKRRGALPLVLTLLALLTLIPLAWAGYRMLADEPQVAPPEKEVPRIAVPDLVNMTLDEAQNEFGDDFDIQVADTVSGERPVDTILNQNPSGGKVEKGSTVEVTVVGTQVAGVPDVEGAARGAAEQELAEAGFEVRTERRESTFEEEGLVMSQEPGGGTRVEVGSEVTISVGTGPPAVEVPNVTGNTPAQAAEILREAGLRLGSQSEDYSAGMAEGGIIYQDPPGGESAEPGSTVDVTVSLGPEQVEVPEVYGTTLAQAQQLVDEAGLDSTTDEVDDQEAAGTALSTDPQAGTLLDPGTTVTIYYSAGPPEVTASPEPTPAPDASASPNASASPDPQAAPEPQVSPENEQEDQGTAGQDDGNPNGGNAPAGRPGNGENSEKARENRRDAKEERRDAKADLREDRKDG